MNNMSKILTCLLCFSLISALLCGCADTTPPETTYAPSASESASNDAADITAPPTPSESSSLKYGETAPIFTEPDFSSLIDSGKNEDLVLTGIFQSFSWKDGVGNPNEVIIALPELSLEYDFALRFNEEIKDYAKKILNIILESERTGSSTYLDSVSYEAYHNDDTLSIVIIEQTAFDLTDYSVYNFDLGNREAMNIADMCDTYLDMSYPEFLFAAQDLTARKFTEKYGQVTESDPDFYNLLLSQIPIDTVSMLNLGLYLGENGTLMLVYDLPSMAGASAYPTIEELDVPSLKRTSKTEAYAFLFELPTLISYWENSDEYWAYDDEYAEACASILKIAFEEDAEGFSEELEKCPQEKIDSIAALLVQEYLQEKEELIRLANELDEANIRNAILKASESIQ